MLKIRNLNKVPGVHTYPMNQEGRQITDDGTDIKIHSRTIKEEMAKKLQKRNIFINLHNGEPIYFYRRLETGRKCSCFEGVSTPSADCPICYKTGIVGGFLKYGTQQNILDITASTINLINVHHSFETKIRPLNFVLDEDSTQGFIFFDFDILQNNKRKMDLFYFLYSGINKNALIRIDFKKPAEISYTPCTKESMETKLDAEKLNFRISISRKHPNVESPKISHFWIRYMILDSCVLNLDIAPSTESKSLDELGTIRNAQPVQAFFDQRLGFVNTEDFIYRLEENERWKPIDALKRKSVGVRTSTDVTLRPIQDFEVYTSYPL